MSTDNVSNKDSFRFILCSLAAYVNDVENWLQIFHIYIGVYYKEMV
jgi:hypothetical protein